MYSLTLLTIIMPFLPTKLLFHLDIMATPVADIGDLGILADQAQGIQGITIINTQGAAMGGEVVAQEGAVLEVAVEALEVPVVLLVLREEPRLTQINRADTEALPTALGGQEEVQEVPEVQEVLEVQEILPPTQLLSYHMINPGN